MSAITREIWRHVPTGKTYVVERVPGGPVIAGSGPLATGDPVAFLRQPVSSDPVVVDLLRQFRPLFTEELELDEQGRLWDFRAKGPTTIFDEDEW